MTGAEKYLRSLVDLNEYITGMIRRKEELIEQPKKQLASRQVSAHLHVNAVEILTLKASQQQMLMYMMKV